MLNNLFLNYITRSTSENSCLNSVNKSLNDLLLNTVYRSPFVVQQERHQVIASFLRYNVRNSAEFLSVIRVACMYAYIEKMKFSTSLCFPLKVSGFSYFMLCYYGICCYCICYYKLLGPASATGCYYYGYYTIYYSYGILLP